MSSSTVGRSVARKDLREKLTGEARFTADLKLPGMLFGAILRSPHPHAHILSVHVSQASMLPGVLATITPFDAPPGRVGDDMPVLDTKVRFVGDEVAAVAATDEDTARQALELITVRYQNLPFVLEPEEALRDGAPTIHHGGNLVGGQPLTLERGSVAQGFEEADLILDEEYEVPTHSAAPLEPRAALASWDEDHLTVWKSSRGVHLDRASLAEALGLPPDKVQVVGPHIGGGYGNKDESRLAALTAVLAQRAGRPVMIEYSRQEEYVAGRARHAARIKMKVGVKAEGNITAIHAIATINTGAYMASGPGVARRMGQAALYLYHCPNVKYEAYLAYTNRPVAGSYRALGAPQGHFALESLMDRVAEALDMDPLDFRRRNQVRPSGQPGRRTTPPDQIVDTQPVEGGIPFSSNGLDQCLRLGAEAFGWNRRRASSGPIGGPLRKGKGMSMLIYRGGPGSTSSAQIKVDRSGRIALVAGLIDVGEGASTVLAQLAAEALGARYEDVHVVFADTSVTPNAPITAGSTATFSTGTAVLKAAAEVREKLLELAAPALESPIETLETGDGHVYVRGEPGRRMPLAQVAGLMEGEYVTGSATVIPGSTEYIVNSFGAHFAEVEVDTDTGRVRVLDYVAAQDSGRIINPRTALNQVEGGVSQMLGFTLSEEMVTDGPTGVTLNASYLEHKSPTILDYPDIRVIFADVVDPVGPMGAKALGEPPCAAVAPAIANAIYDAIGARITRLPITPDLILGTLYRGAVRRG